MAALVIAATAGGWYLYRAGKRYSRIDWGSDFLNWLDGFNRWFCLNYHRNVSRAIALPAHGPGVVVSNHLSGLDPFLLIAASRRPLRFLIAREQYNRFGMTWLFKAGGCIPVDRSGRPERALREAISALRKGEVIALFPHGKIHLPSDPPRKLKGGAVRLAQRGECDIYPLKVSGVKGEGHIVRGVLYRSHAKVRLLPVIKTEGRSHEELTEVLEEIYNRC